MSEELTKRKHIRLPIEIDDWLKAESERSAKPMNAIIVESLERYRDMRSGQDLNTEMAKLIAKMNREVDKAASTK